MVWWKVVMISSLFCVKIMFGQSISSTAHNLSVSGSGSIKASSEDEICIFCHTPHNSSPQKPLWNRNDPGANYTLYNSSTLNANPGQPDGSSILCLSCHDGTIALGNVLSRLNDISFSGGITTIPSGRSNLSTDLSDDHPISFNYNSALASSDGELVMPSVISSPVHLENGKMQCVSCHDPHVNIYGNFLIANRQYSALCLSCHDKNNWWNSKHKNNNKSWNGNGVDPWPNSSYTTVAQNGCENCHTSHNSGGNERLRNSIFEENNCLNCHNGNVASKNLEAEFNKTYTHNIYGYTNVHDANENIEVQNMHVECVDCHNPHEVSGINRFRGVTGINTDGIAIYDIQYEYEICYKCHGNSFGKPPSPTTRYFNENNTINEFDLNNASYHPIEGLGKNGGNALLLDPSMTTIKCSDCHSNNSNRGNSPNGPHGSIYPQILKYNYNRNNNVPESASNYELCYSCHNRNGFINDAGSDFQRKVHYKHVTSENITCNSCHDPHGVTNSTHLINFDLSVVSPFNGVIEFIDNGIYAGQCTLSCHGKDHEPEVYPDS